MKENSKTKNVIITTVAEINKKNKEFWNPDRKKLAIDATGAFGSIPSPPKVQFLLPKDKIMSPEDFTDNFTPESFKKARAKSMASEKARKTEDEIPPLTRPKRKFSI